MFCFNFPRQTDDDDVYKCPEDQVLVIIRLSPGEPSGPARQSKQVPHCGAGNVSLLLL